MPAYGWGGGAVIVPARLVSEVGCSGACGCQPPGRCFSGGLCARAHGLCGGDGLRLRARVCSLLWRQGDLFAAAAGPSPACLLVSARPALLSTWRQGRSCALAPALSVAMDGVLACEVATTASGVRTHACACSFPYSFLSQYSLHATSPFALVHGPRRNHNPITHG